ncbi:MAG: nitroreductase family protein [Candidatus Eisenbacteria bacterium]|uniref:Nitroreductase family protein n=1 Tax=Eiseniibacteriota bacterium TaxID=2212470 RepID=A0A938BQZ3_UNCEI|nr:nitroreductase family protein [Candidatus Eisenbacteria bacterium]
MELQEVLRSRYSVRAYKPDEVERDKLLEILEAARLAPTAANRQAFQLIVIRTAGREEALRRIYNKDWFVQAPLVIAVCGLREESWVRRDGHNYVDVDAAIVMDHLILRAADSGLGTCWIAAFDPAAARAELGLPRGVEAIAFTPLGYPADEPGPKKRKPLSELVRSERW